MKQPNGIRRIAAAFALLLALSSVPLFAADDGPSRPGVWRWLDALRHTFARVIHVLDDGQLSSPPGSH